MLLRKSGIFEYESAFTFLVLVRVICVMWEHLKRCELLETTCRRLKPPGRESGCFPAHSVKDHGAYCNRPWWAFISMSRVKDVSLYSYVQIHCPKFSMLFSSYFEFHTPEVSTLFAISTCKS